MNQATCGSEHNPTCSGFCLLSSWQKSYCSILKSSKSDIPQENRHGTSVYKLTRAGPPFQALLALPWETFLFVGNVMDSKIPMVLKRN